MEAYAQVAVLREIVNAHDRCAETRGSADAHCPRGPRGPRIGISNHHFEQVCPPSIRVTSPMWSPSLGAAWFAWAIRGASRLLRRAVDLVHAASRF